KLQGNLLREPFEQAVHFALERHPLLASRLCHVRGKGPCWVLAATPTPQICWADSRSSTKRAFGERFDLGREIGLRIWVDADSLGADVLLAFHHACTDGIGAVQLIGDLLARYGQLTARGGDERPEIEPVNLDALRARADYSTNKSERAARSFSYS